MKKIRKKSPKIWLNDIFLYFMKDIDLSYIDLTSILWKTLALGFFDIDSQFSPS